MVSMETFVPQICSFAFVSLKNNYKFTADDSFVSRNRAFFGRINTAENTP